MSGRRGRRPEARAETTAAPGAAPWKVHLAATVVVLAALWPIAHRILVARFDANPWKLGGSAMYAAPAPPLIVAVYGLRDGQLVRVQPAALPIAEQVALRRFETDRHALGELRRPDAVAAAILAADPTLAQLSVVVQRTTLNRASAHLDSERMQYSYDRSGPREVRRTMVPAPMETASPGS